ncbi:1-phosphofructokinase family hexose kinase [Luteimicrobium xylanilyticum]|uniref:1-phosphofructokinase n=1 Tax=Luteimicrobium xylanilyticum TaxID=1133546 RepID=A0A5P9QBR7_9MICO|nr:hexose kinase [Luteimicrobium xylanilyticum]QFU98789.1 1-phosphofructokinase [Luteimicrobium xylanilyticum]
MTGRVVVVTPNPAVDVTYDVDRQLVGETLRVREVRRRPGGKGVNVARVLVSAGVDCTSVLPLGGETGRWVRSSLVRARVDLAAVEIGAATRTTVTVVDGAQHPTILTEPGPHVEADEWAHVDRVVARVLVGAAALVVSGSLPPGADPRLVARWVRQAREAGVPAFADVSGAALVAAASAGAVLKPNAHEICEATGAPDEAAGAMELLERGAACVVVSRGSEGLVARTPSRTVVVPAVAGISGNPVGAGDAATAGLVRATLAGADLADALRQAAAFGAAAVLSPVAGEADAAVAHSLLDRIPSSHEGASLP